MMKFTIVGSGTSTGVPTVGCSCPTCCSTDEKDKRLRSSLLIESDTTSILIDTTPDFRQQMLRQNVRSLDAVLYTHHHFDHIGGFDDLRAINFATHKPLNIFLNQTTLDQIKRAFFYAFEIPEQIGGGVPMVNPHIINNQSFTIGNIKILPFTVKHGILDVIGYRIGKVAYITDASYIPDEVYPLLDGIEILIINALRYHRHETHFNIEEAINEVYRIKPKTSYFIHIAHQIKHSDCQSKLPENIFISYDGLQFQI